MLQLVKLQSCKHEPFDKSRDVSFPVTCYITFAKLHNKYFFVCLQQLRISSSFLLFRDLISVIIIYYHAFLEGAKSAFSFYLNGVTFFKNLVINSFNFQMCLRSFMTFCFALQYELDCVV